MSGEEGAARYACTKCMQWFEFDQLSQDKLMCSNCVEAGPSKSKDSLKIVKKSKPSTDSKRSNVCKYCKTDMKSKSSVCDRCLKNLNEHGKPKKCVYCKLQSAFIGSKCQRCSSSQKKYGPPVACNKCKSKSAFDHAKARINGSVLCWLCYVTTQRHMRKLKRKHSKSSDPAEKVTRYSPSQPYLFSHDDEVAPSDHDQEEIWDQLDVEVVREKISQNPEDGSRIHPDARHKKDAKGDGLLKQAQLNYRRSKEKRDRGKMSLESRLSGMKKTFSAPNSPSASLSPASSAAKEEKTMSSGNTPKSDSEQPTAASLTSWQAQDRVKNGASNNMPLGLLPTISDSNIVMVTKLREEILALKKQVSKKEQQLIEKDKQISVLKVEHLTEVRSIQTKLKSQEESYIKSMESLRSKNQELLKKIAQISKGKA